MYKEQELRLDPVALEAARRATGTIPGAAYWNDCARIIAAYIAALPSSDEQAEVAGDQRMAIAHAILDLATPEPSTERQLAENSGICRAANVVRNWCNPPSPALAAGGVTEEQVEAAARSLAADHYAHRFQKTGDDPHVVMNVDANWQTFSRDAKIALTAALAVRDEGISSDDLVTAVLELLQTVHQPTPKAGSDYWHVTAGKHVEFGKLVTKLHSLLALPTPPSRGEGV